MEKKIKNYENYLINSNGDVYSINSKKNLSQKISKTGYCSVHLPPNKMFYVHRLVADAFIENPLNLPEVNHIDGNKLNNNASNLEWCTHQTNMKHGYKLGLINNTGENNTSAKLTQEKVDEIRKKYIPWKYTQARLGKEYNISQAHIARIILNKRW